MKRQAARYALPPAMVRNVELYFGRRGTAWLADLPRLVEEFARRWDLEVEVPFPDLSIGYVAPARRADGTRCVLKLGVPNDELDSEVESLGYWGGGPMVRLLDASAADGAMLLERVEPGASLVDQSQQDDDAATQIAARLMQRLWQPLPLKHGLGDLQGWFERLLMHRQLRGGPEPFPDQLLQRAEETTLWLLDSTEPPALLHGDLHHSNILSSDRAGWVAIDPKGLVGDPAFEVATFVRNPSYPPAPVLARRLGTFSAELGFTRSRLRDWCFAEAMLNACWSLDDADSWFQAKVDWAQMLLTV